MAEADAVGLDYAIDTASVTDAATCQLFDLWYTGMCGARLHAKYLKPVSDEPVPLVLQFHGYPGASRSWFEQASFAGMGMALIALDCPGQGACFFVIFMGYTFAIASKPGTTEQAGQIEAPTIEEETEIKTLPWWKSILYIIGGLAASFLEASCLLMVLRVSPAT